MKSINYYEVIDQGILYNFIPYETPLLATYCYPGDKYDVNNGGWQNEEKSVLVIGETKDSFITELRPAKHEEWKDKRILYQYILPIGFHKSRLIKWQETQLTLF